MKNALLNCDPVYGVIQYNSAKLFIILSSRLTDRLAAQAELLVLSSSRRRRLRPADTRSSATKRHNPELWGGSDTNSSSSGSDSESRRAINTTTTVVRRRSVKSHRQRQRTEWRKSLPTSLGRQWQCFYYCHPVPCVVILAYSMDPKS